MNWVPPSLFVRCPRFVLGQDQTIALTSLVAVAVPNVASSYIAMAITSAALGDAWAHAPEKLAAASGDSSGSVLPPRCRLPTSSNIFQ